jgi:hypothetical protein
MHNEPVPEWFQLYSEKVGRRAEVCDHKLGLDFIFETSDRGQRRAHDKNIVDVHKHSNTASIIMAFKHAFRV